MKCKGGYVNAGGPLNITCIDGSWTTFPKCVPYNGNDPVSTTVYTGAPCPLDLMTFPVENGFITDTTAPQLPLETTYSGIQMKIITDLAIGLCTF